MVDASILHLVRRATYGPTPAVLAEAGRLGAGAWLERQLAPSSIPDPACAALMKRYPQIAWTIPTVRQKVSGGSWDVMLALSQATLVRAVWSQRQLFEVMVEFWSNHLNIACPSSDVWDNRAHYDRAVIRPNALGSFREMLLAATIHPAMLRYLDNASSTKAHPNENQGRELLELHTVGVDAGYTEADVRASARILTGVTVNSAGALTYTPEAHYTGQVSVLGFTHPNTDASAGLDVVKAYVGYLAVHPATAARIARKLAVRFVSDDPPQGLVDRLAQVYLANDTAITPVLRALFGSAEFAASAGQKVRRPYEDLVATVRILGLGPDRSGTSGEQALYWISSDLGQPPLAWGPPDGYPDVADAWQSPAGTLSRWNTHIHIAARWWPHATMLTGKGAMAFVPKKLPATHGEFIDGLARQLVHRPADATEKAAICAFVSDSGGTVTPATKLTAKSPLVTWRLPYAVSLFLDSPAHAIR